MVNIETNGHLSPVIFFSYSNADWPLNLAAPVSFFKNGQKRLRTG